MGYTISDELLDRIIYDFDRNNANMSFNAGSVEQGIFEALSKKIALKELGNDLPEVVQLYKDGYVHLNDLSSFFTRPSNCFNLNPKYILDHGFVANGDRNVHNVSKPPKYLNSALNQIMEACINISSEQSGGIGVAYFNWYIAPLWKLTDEKEKRQSIQNFIYRFNQLLRAGNQPMFSSLNLCLVCPSFLEDEYGEYQVEADEIIRYICNLCIEGDARGNMFRFPNLVFNITDAELENYMEIFELTNKFGSPYFCRNQEGDESFQAMGCRSALPSNYTHDPSIDCQNVGNAVYSTVNLPMIALEYPEWKDFKQELKNIMCILYKYTHLRRNKIQQRINDNFMPFLTQPGLYELDNMTLVIGILGLDETIQHLNGTTHIQVLEYCNNIIKSYKEKDGLRWGLFSPPSENAAHRLALKCVEKHGFRNSKANGTYDAPYYTNGVNLNVNNKDLLKQLKEETNHSDYVKAGNINNFLMGDSYSMPEALLNLTNKIRENTQSFFWSYTFGYSICRECDTLLKGSIEHCPLCDGETDIYSRVTGYMTNTKTWNKGKQEEQKDREYYA